MRHLVRLRHYLAPYKWQFLAALVCTLSAGAFVMVSPLLIREAIRLGMKTLRASALRLYPPSRQETMRPRAWRRATSRMRWVIQA